jgi:LmbE family N-acetylglucosaminyl deacetylase
MNTQNKNTFLFIGAHPDDETQVAGTMAQLSRCGFDVYSYITTPGRGGKPNIDEKDASDDIILQDRKKEAELFAKEIGMSTYIRDNRTQFLENSEEDVLELVRFLRKIRPTIVVLQNPGDYHFEHKSSHTLGLRALEIAMRSMLLELGPKITDVIILETDGLNVLSNPSIFFNISKTQELKKNAIVNAYGERLGGLTQLDEGLSMMRGGRIGVEHAECFALLNPSWYRFTAKAGRTLQEFLEIGT